MKLGESMAVILGGLATVLACVLAGVELARGGFSWWILPLLVVVFWREAVFARMRMELDKMRGHSNPDNSPI
jgi:4-hydroxybenzoate polyprenyltransferase